MIKNKRGASLSGWTELGLVVVILALALIMAGTALNSTYSQNNDFSFGLVPNETLNSFTTAQDSQASKVADSTATFTDQQGLTLSALWGMIKGIYNTATTFLTGGLVENVVQLAGLPIWLGKVLRLLFLFSLTFIIIKLITKVRP